MLTIEQFRHIVPDETLSEIYQRAKRLYGKHIVHLNSTYQGGGVAEILYSLVLLMNDVGIDTGWRNLYGSSDFFNVTKKFHNALQGADLNLSERKKSIYLAVNDNFSKFTHLRHNCVIVHDPQPLALIRFYRKQQPWIWRCHIDLTDPHSKLWGFLKGFLLKYDQVVVSSEKYIKDDLPVNQRIIFPAINPLTPKNMDIDEKTIMRFIKKEGIPTDKPIITQVSRLDPWKDPVGVLKVFERVREKVDCRLIFCYNVASDDPEGLRMYSKVYESAQKYVESGDVMFVVGNDQVLVNSIQRFSNVIIQKSTKEGFCLAVTEALWKETPVVASRVGGIPIQIKNNKNGFLLEPNDLEGFAERIIYLLKNPKDSEQMGVRARETVRNKFLTTRLLSDYLDMLNSVMLR